jgi:hypothetical protein
MEHTKNGEDDDGPDREATTLAVTTKPNVPREDDDGKPGKVTTTATPTPTTTARQQR